MPAPNGQGDVVAPPAPETIDSVPVLRWYDYPLYLPLFAFRIGVLLAMCWRIGGNLHGSAAPAFLMLSLLLLAPAVFDQFVWLSLWWYRIPTRRPAPSGLRVAAVTTYVGGSESIEMLAVTLRHMAAMNYEHDTWVLDEDDDARVRDLCAQTGVHHFSRKDLPLRRTDSGPFKAGTKFGNYNAWLHEIGFEKYDIISAFDCDHVPQAGFLEAVLGFFRDPRVGYVQAAQCYSNQSSSFIARGAAEESYAYYSIVQGSAAAFGYPVITGCHNTHRTTALRQIGGFASHDADDLLLTVHYKAAGWRGIYVPQRLANGLAPVSWHSYLGQQRRWARSLLDLKLRPPPNAREIGFAPRVISILQGIRYVLDGGFFISVFCLVAMLLTGSAQSLAILREVVIIYLVIIFSNLYVQRFYLDPAAESGLPWRAFLLRFAKWPYTLMALLDVLQNRNYAYAITPKNKSTSSGKVTMYFQFALAGCIAVAWAVGYTRGQITNPALHLLAAGAIAVPALLGISGRMRFAPEFSGAAAPLPAAPCLSRKELLSGSFIAALSFVMALLGLRGTAVWQDTARHLMNGTFIYDCIRTGNLFHVREFGRWYFAHYPALSMPYHPPLLPMAEALVFAVLGPSFQSARLLIALTVGFCCFLLYRSVLISSASKLISLCAPALFLFIPGVSDFQQNVALEFPALLSVLLGLNYMARIGVIETVPQGVIYGTIVAAGILTEQTVFMILVPFACCLITQKWRALLQPGLWVSSAIGAAAGGFLLMLSRVVGWWSVPPASAPLPPWQTLPNTWFYGLISAMALIALLSVVWSSVRRNQVMKNVSLYTAWILSGLIVLLPARSFGRAYLFFVLPAVCALTLELFYGILIRVLNTRVAGTAIAAATLAFCIWNGRATPVWLTGPEVVASRLASEEMRKILFFGADNGAFIFSTRLHDPQLKATIFRGDKIFGDGISSQLLQQFAYDYGVDAVVFQCQPGSRQACTRFVQDVDSFPPMFEQTVSCSRPGCASTLEVYRVANRSDHPRMTFQEKVRAFGSMETFDLETYGNTGQVKAP